jgi:hypothetical protein
MKAAMIVDTSRFNALLKDYAKETGKKMGEVVRHATTILAKSFMISTKPRSKGGGDGDFRKTKKGEIIYHGKDDRALGEQKVLQDIGKVFGSFAEATNIIKAASEDAARGFSLAIRRGDYDEAERILKSLGGKDANAKIGDLDPQIHSQSTRGGRKKNPPKARFVKDKELRDYQRKIVARVGFAKSAWYHAGLAIGKMTNVPAWIKRHPNTGVGSADLKSSNPSATIKSLVTYASQTLTQQQQNEAMHYARGRMTAMIKHAIDRKKKRIQP